MRWQWDRDALERRPDWLWKPRLVKRYEPEISLVLWVLAIAMWIAVLT